MGLTREHHDELNAGGVGKERFSELRLQYKGDSVACQQIDTYEPGSPYKLHLSELVEA